MTKALLPLLLPNPSLQIEFDILEDQHIRKILRSQWPKHLFSVRNRLTWMKKAMWSKPVAYHVSTPPQTKNATSEIPAAKSC